MSNILFAKPLYIITGKWRETASLLENWDLITLANALVSEFGFRNSSHLPLALQSEHSLPRVNRSASNKLETLCTFLWQGEWEVGVRIVTVTAHVICPKQLGYLQASSNWSGTSVLYSPEPSYSSRIAIQTPQKGNMIRTTYRTWGIIKRTVRASNGPYYGPYKVNRNGHVFSTNVPSSYDTYTYLSSSLSYERTQNITRTGLKIAQSYSTTPRWKPCVRCGSQTWYVRTEHVTGTAHFSWVATEFWITFKRGMVALGKLGAHFRWILYMEFSNPSFKNPSKRVSLQVNKHHDSFQMNSQMTKRPYITALKPNRQTAKRGDADGNQSNSRPVVFRPLYRRILEKSQQRMFSPPFDINLPVYANGKLYLKKADIRVHSKPENANRLHSIRKRGVQQSSNLSSASYPTVPGTAEG
ncbi:uncharacterized protein BDR25DRAFT_393844 [Lindgomyces ingoldianus]|uniref:Uncharacterized protein n=1 Tax=Lindgomyces ingoldianus TaxID=673940 RepID=A0ACB6QUV8_9PLEO|nr:uncharacterized protein BDR25DRAFT_393844 [Lindgomyces ingoldianus]KAF2470290.1 hypothetical protein BDR25DRAFT_393844 [Lindgomyces ingoldianus]